MNNKQNEAKKGRGVTENKETIEHDTTRRNIARFVDDEGNEIEMEAEGQQTEFMEDDEFENYGDGDHDQNTGEKDVNAEGHQINNSAQPIHLREEGECSQDESLMRRKPVTLKKRSRASQEPDFEDVVNKSLTNFQNYMDAKLSALEKALEESRKENMAQRKELEQFNRNEGNQILEEFNCDRQSEITIYRNAVEKEVIRNDRPMEGIENSSQRISTSSEEGITSDEQLDLSDEIPKRNDRLEMSKNFIVGRKERETQRRDLQ